MKMKRIIVLIMLPLVFFLIGCPYSSDYPIDNPNIKVDIGLLGRWEDATGGSNLNNKKTVYTVTKKSEFIYGIETTSSDLNSETNKYETSTTSYEGHISIVNTTKFINIKQKSPEDNGKYSFYKIEVAGNNCILSEVSSCIDKTFSSSADLKAFILKNLENELLFFSSQTFFRN